MLYEILNLDDHVKFSEKYNLLRDSNRIADVQDLDIFFNYWDKYPDRHFSAAFAEEFNFKIGIISVDNKKLFPVGVNGEGRIILFDKLEKFINIK